MINKLRPYCLVALLSLPAALAAEANARFVTSDRVSEGLVAYYPLLGEDPETVSDESGFGSPLDLQFEGEVTRLSGQNGVILSGGMLTAPGEKLTTAIQETGEATFEVWAKAANTQQNGPARLLSLSHDPYQRNFTLGQNRVAVEVRLRNTSGSDNGSPYLKRSDVFDTAVRHFVVTLGGGTLRLYRDGELVKEEERSGGLGNWDPSHAFLIGNEATGDRPWEGEVYLAAVYNRALLDSEVQRNFLVGPDLTAGGVSVPNAPPEVDAGGDRTVLMPGATTVLLGAVGDDGLPAGSLNIGWTKVSGPGDVSFASADTAATQARFSAPGEYVLALEVSDGELTGRDEILATVVESSRVGDSLIALYPLDEGTGAVAHDVSGFGEALDLEFGGEASWLEGRNGVRLGRRSRLEGVSAAKVTDAITTAGEFTFEVWAKPDNITQGGPARLVTLSQDGYKRNFTLGQQAARAEVRLRTADSTDNGSPYLREEGAFTADTHHFAVTYADGLLNLYRDGVLQRSETRNGDFSNWDPSYALVVGNEYSTERDWRGEVHMVAIYRRALSGPEVERNYMVGGDLAGGGNNVANRAPSVNAGLDRTILLPAKTVHLRGETSDDGFPGAGLTYEWSGPAGVVFSSPTALATTASFPGAGSYTLALNVSDGELTGTDQLEVLVADSSRVTENLIAFYPFNEGGGDTAFDQSGTSPDGPADPAARPVQRQMAADLLDLQVSGDVEWLEGRNGVRLGRRSRLSSDGPAVKVNSAITASNEFTFEVWAKPENLTQGGPARMVSVSQDGYKRNFTLGQQAARAEVRLRTTDGSDNGSPYLRSDGAFDLASQHFAVTYADGLLSLYRDGQLLASEPRDGNFSNWDQSFPLLVGNENGTERDWRGEIYVVAVYDRALNPSEVERNYLVGDNIIGGGNTVSNTPPEVSAGPDKTVLYPTDSVRLFGEASDDGLPGPGLTITWSGPDVGFAPSNALDTVATFPGPGIYTLELKVSDGEFEVTDQVEINVALSARVSDGLIAFYPFNEGFGETALNQAGDPGPPGPVVLGVGKEPSSAAAVRTMAGSELLSLEFGGEVAWLEGRNGVTLGRNSRLSTNTAGEFHSAITGTDEFTFEVWAKPENLTQGGPARLMSFSFDGYKRNFTLGQQGARAEVRLRTTSSSDNGSPYLRKENAFAQQEQHFVVTYADGVLSLYRDGQLLSSEDRDGDFSNWDPTYAFLIGNENNTERDWRGEVYQAAVYERALTPAEVQRNYQVGADLTGGGQSVANQPPAVSAGDDQIITPPNMTTDLHGTVEDDGLPGNGMFVSWTVAEGPGTAVFGSPGQVETSVTFSEPGAYRLVITADDGALSASDEVVVSVSESQRVTRDLVAYYPMTGSGGDVVLDQSNSGEPLDLEISGEVTPLPNRNGYLVGRNGKMQSAAAAKIHSAVTANGAFTFEIWAKAASTALSGPARLLSNSIDAYNRNFTLGPQKQDLHIRLRTTESDNNGKPYLVASGATSTATEHYVVTFDGSNLRLYRGGTLIQEEPRGGDLSNWDPAYPLLVGNEATTSRSWQGEVYLAAVYSRALSSPEVMRNYLVGAEIEQGGMPVPNMQPLVSAGPDRMITLPENSVMAVADAVDDGLPADNLTFAWTQLSGPQNAVFSSASALHPSVQFPADGDYVLQLTVTDGEHVVTDEFEVAVIAEWVPRLLDQATWGPTAESLEAVRHMDSPADFIARQLAAAPSGYPPSESSSSPSELQYRFFHNARYGEDQLRQRMAFALHQIFVVSGNTVGRREQLTPYLNILEQHALGSFKDLMFAMTLNPTMGKYLDMVNNAKPGDDGKPPNENYPRELLQLFTKGTVKLNMDGTPQIGSDGKPIPGYTEEDVRQLTLALTGWTYPTKPGNSPRWPNREYFDGEMEPHEDKHDTSEKVLLDGLVLPAGQTARQDLEAALNHVFEMPSVAPFISKQLIQHLVTSNPSPGYVQRVATVFRNTAGDLGAVAEAILTDAEAGAASANGGHLRSPVLFANALLRALGAHIEEVNQVKDETERMGQRLFYPPSVFSYYSQFYRVPDFDLLGPEFQIHTAAHATDRADFVYRVVTNRVRRGVEIDLSPFLAVAGDANQLVDKVDLALFQGRMSEALRATILRAMEKTSKAETRVQNAIYIAATSSEYQVQH